MKLKTPMQYRVTKVDETFIHFVTDTGVKGTAPIELLITENELYGAGTSMTGVTYKVPIWDERGIKKVSEEYITPFTYPSNELITSFDASVVNVGGGNCYINWEMEHKPFGDNTIVFKNTKFAAAYVERMSRVMEEKLTVERYKQAKAINTMVG